MYVYKHNRGCRPSRDPEGRHLSGARIHPVLHRPNQVQDTMHYYNYHY